MCGLAGMIGREIWQADRKMFRELLYITALRGTDSTGVMTAGFGKKDWIEVEKAAVPAASFIRSSMAQQWSQLDDYSADVFMAHCRDATVGTVTKENAHPFNLPTLVGCHNGTLVDGKYRIISKGKTDSELMFEDMEKQGVKATLEGLSQSSAYAISVFEKGGTSVKLARNKKRPLWIGLNTDRACIYWSSEQEMLELVAARNNVNIKTYYLIADTIYTFDYHKVKKGDVQSWTAEDVVYKTPLPTPAATVKPTVWVSDKITVGSTTVRVGHPEEIAEAKDESYFDSIFEGALTEADFDHEGKPLPHVRPSMVDELFNKGSDVMEAKPDEEFIPEFLKKAKDDGPNYGAEGEMWWDEECCMCSRHLVGKDLDNATHVRIDNVDYYSCQICNDDVEQRVENAKKRRRPDLDETVLPETEVTTH